MEDPDGQAGRLPLGRALQAMVAHPGVGLTFPLDPQLGVAGAALARRRQGGVGHG